MLKRFVSGMLLAVVLTVLLAPGAVLAELDFSFLPRRTYEGKVYEARPSAELTTVLFIGYDHSSYGTVKELHGYSNGGQSDFMLLIVVDHAQKTVRQLQIDRDTMSPIYVTDVMGKQHLRSNLQICLAHAYGDTREKNNANTILAVETLLGIEGKDDGAGIDWYMAMDISGIRLLNDLLGGVTVTIEDDITAYDPTMTAGTTMRLSGMQAEYFCRGRYYVGDQTNASRMKRQRQYLTAASEVLRQRLSEDVNFGNYLLDEMGVIYDLSTAASDDPFSFADPVQGTPSGEREGFYLTTNESQSEIVGLLARAMDYEIMEPETLPGSHILGTSGYIEFKIEKDAARRWAMDVFYRGE